LADSLVALGRTLLSQTWPANADADIHTLAAASELEAEDLYGGLDVTNIAKFNHDAAASTADAQVVRADLGLPPVSR
jgi:hypothetical protein